MKVLILQTAFIGDVILCTPLVHALSGKGHEVGFVVKPEAAGILERDPRISRLFIYDKREKDKGIGGIIKLAQTIKEQRYDAAIIPHRSIRSALIMKLSGIPVRIGFDKSAGSFLFTHKIKYEQFIHEVKRNHNLLEPLEINDAPTAPRILYDDDDLKAGYNLLKSWGINNSVNLIAFGPGSKWPTKQWGVEKYKALSLMLFENIDCHIVCFGGPEESELCDKIVSDYGKKIFNAAGKLTLRQSAAALSFFRTAVANDNGFMHLSAASGIPVTAVFGPTIPGFGFAPWGDNHTIEGIEIECRPCGIHGAKKCPEKHFKCMLELSPEKVYESVINKLQAANG